MSAGGPSLSSRVLRRSTAKAEPRRPRPIPTYRPRCWRGLASRPAPAGAPGSPARRGRRHRPRRRCPRPLLLFPQPGLRRVRSRLPQPPSPSSLLPRLGNTIWRAVANSGRKGPWENKQERYAIRCTRSGRGGASKFRGSSAYWPRPSASLSAGFDRGCWLCVGGCCCSDVVFQRFRHFNNPLPSCCGL